MNDMSDLFPKLKKNIENLIEDEEGNIPGSKLLMLGTMVIILGSIMSIDALAAHSSHVSHSSHTSHSSGTTTYSHSNHASHTSHTSHVSHTSHSNTASHSNSLYSSEGDVTYNAPAASNVPSVTTSPVTTTEDTFVLPDVNENIELPNGTPSSGFMASFAVPSTSPRAKIDVGALNVPSRTDQI